MGNFSADFAQGEALRDLNHFLDVDER